ncbi:Glycoside hydrolase family 1 protein [Mycena kentingensis (nom. inval.)]|nr:Glycoside hydrolase family 1 protein [Mycena kentingensis (nom. inval.)]
MTDAAQLSKQHAIVRQEIINAAQRGRRVEEELALLRREPLPVYDPMSEVDLAKQTTELSRLVAEERAKLQSAETTLQDVLRECENPVVVPELVRLACKSNSGGRTD